MCYEIWYVKYDLPFSLNFWLTDQLIVFVNHKTVLSWLVGKFFLNTEVMNFENSVNFFVFLHLEIAFIKFFIDFQKL